MAYKIYTSYYKNIPFLKSNGIIPVGISRFPPTYVDYNILELSPSAELLMKYKNDHDKKYYIDTFNDYLNNFDHTLYISQINEISKENDNKDIALCCYEMPDEFCHRHIVAEYLNNLNMFSNIHEITAKDINKTSIELF